MFITDSYHSFNRDIKERVDFNDYFRNTLIELAINRFRWKNLPDTIDPRYLETTLLLNGSVVFFEDEIMGFHALGGAYTGLDMQYNPTDYYVVTPTGYQPRVHIPDGVIIWNNFTRTSDMPTIYMYADNIGEIYQTAMVNIRGQKHPIVVLVDSESERMSMENAYAKLDGNHPVIYARRKARIEEKFVTIDAKVPFIAPDLLRTGRILTEEALKWFGIKVPNIEKKERQVAQEQTDKNAVTYQLRNRGLHARQVACDSINKKWNLGLEVEFDEEACREYADLLMNNWKGQEVSE